MQPETRARYGALAKKLISLAVFLLVAYVLWRRLREIDWNNVLVSLRSYEAPIIILAAAMALVGFALYGGYDLLGRRYTRHRLGTATTLSAAVISHVFTLNVGALLGGGGFRYRLYSRAGLSGVTIAQIWTFSFVTNWLGYFAVAGAALVFFPPRLPPAWPVGAWALPWIGAAFWLLLAVYLLACAFSPRRSWTVRGHTIHLPRTRMACTQVSLSALNWLLVSGIAFLLIPGDRVGYGDVTSTYLVASISAGLAHVPGGLGVIETIFVLLLGHRLPEAQIVAAVLAFRAVQYVGPLLVAVPGVFVFEALVRPPKAQVRVGGPVRESKLASAR